MLKSYFYVSSKRFRQMDGTRSCVRLYHNTMCVMWPCSVCVPAFIFITEIYLFFSPNAFVRRFTFNMYLLIFAAIGYNRWN